MKPASRAALPRWLAAALLVVCAGCASSAFEQARALDGAGDPVGALAVLDRADQRGEVRARDRALLELERGWLAHWSGDYRASTQALARAGALWESEVPLSLSEQGIALLANDWAGSYRGERSEQLWRHTVAMMSFLLAGNWSAAAVEARLASDRLGERALAGAHYSRALAALSFELAGFPSDAWVSLRALADGGQALPLSSWRIARRVGSAEGQAHWGGRLPAGLRAAAEGGGGELVLLIAQGRGPHKVSSSLVWGEERVAFPVYLAPPPPPPPRVLDGDGAPLAAERVSTVLYPVARAALDARAARLLAKGALRGRLKHELVDKLDERDELAAGLLRAALFVLEEADTRGWDSLPARWTLLRVPLAPGQRELQVVAGGQRQRLRLHPGAGPVQLRSLRWPSSALP